MATNLNNRKVKSGTYSNGFETFRIGETDRNEIIDFIAETSISYFRLKQGDTIQLRKETVESLLNDEYIAYIHR
jgi:hypothetical protein